MENGPQRGNVVEIASRRRKPFIELLRATVEVANEPVEPIVQEVENLLAVDDAPAIVYGEPGSMKTWLMLHLLPKHRRRRAFSGSLPGAKAQDAATTEGGGLLLVKAQLWQ